jgi:hypothetical protein
MSEEGKQAVKAISLIIVRGPLLLVPSQQSAKALRAKNPL